MASDHLIKETNKFLERIAKAAERTATALEKMVVEDDDVQSSSEEELEQQPIDTRSEFDRLVQRLFAGSKVCVETDWAAQTLTLIMGNVYDISKDQAYRLIETADWDKITFVDRSKTRVFKRFEGWVGA